MRSIWIISPIIAIGLTTSAPAQQQVDQNTRQQLDSLYAAYHDNWNKQDGAGIASLYTPDGVLVTSDGVNNGSQAIIEHYKDLFKRGITHHDSATIDQMMPLGNNAVISWVNTTFPAKGRTGLSRRMAIIQLLMCSTGARGKSGS
jgi:uncharacterized protein (TIGR02246 family)